MKNIITAGKYKGMEYEGTFGFENCTVTQERDEHSGKDVIIIKYEDGTLSGALTKKDTLEETLKDWKHIMLKNGHEEEQIDLAVEKVKKFF